MNEDEKIKLFRSIFRGREDVYALYWKSKEERSGYSPDCKNKFKEGICDFPCFKCESQNYIPVSDLIIKKHLAGNILIGNYPLMADNVCYYLAADFDNHNGNRDPLQDAIEFRDVCEVQGIPCYIERSKSGKGYHAWIIFSGPVPAWKARLVGFALLKESGVVDEEDKRSFDRLFPNQDEQTGKGLGNLIALPLWGRAVSDGNSTFLDVECNLVSDVWEFLRGIEKVPESKLDEIIVEWKLKREAPRNYRNSPKNQNKASKSNDEGWINELLVGVDEGGKEGGRNVCCAKLAGWYLRKLDGDKDSALVLLMKWDERNNPPMGAKAVEKVVNSISARQGKEELGEVLNIQISKVTFLESSDGEGMYNFEFIINGEKKICQMPVEDISSQTKFRNAVLRIAPVYFSSMKKSEYDKYMQQVIDEAETGQVSIDTTLTGTILRIVQIGIQNSSDNHRDIDRRMVISEGMVYLKISYIQYHLEGFERLSLKQIGKELSFLGFSNGTRIYDEEKKQHRVWSIEKKTLDKSYEDQL